MRLVFSDLKLECKKLDQNKRDSFFKFLTVFTSKQKINSFLIKLCVLIQVSGQIIEVRTPITHRDYSNLISQEDPNHFLVYKTRRCFLYKNQYFQLDIYREPCHERCKVKQNDVDVF